MFDISDPRNHVQVGYYDTPGYSVGVVVDGNYAFVADGSNLGIYDCSAAFNNVDYSFNPPSSFSLMEAYPNPFNSKVVIKYSLPRNDFVRMQIFDCVGRLMETLIEDERVMGSHQVVWNAQDHPAGAYNAKLILGDEAIGVTQLILVK